ncbi:DoxX family protein [Actinomadura rupiterrae]|uniref:DoxX family protein n=1 Tax=Actinomadura rupiterrae TaxID=559627 RepID=UPI0020A2AE6D|nr:DoxX family protein [Actinomadura rupiterrae]MCP2337225.1 putative membrane protein [Actinomadura rupiterrae]
MTASTTPTATATEAHRTGRKAGIALWTLQALMAAAFVIAGASKVALTDQAVQGFHKIGLGEPGLIVIGTLELLGAVALMIPILSGLSGAALSTLLVGATITEFVADTPAMALVPLAYLVPVAIIAYGRRGQTVRLMAAVRGFRR